MESNHHSPGCHPGVFTIGPRDHVSDRGRCRTCKITRLSTSSLCLFAYSAAVCYTAFMCQSEFFLAESDYAPLAEFPLLWRWTDPKYVLLSEEQLSHIRPLNACAAQKAHSLGRLCIQDRSRRPSIEVFEPSVECDTSGDPSDGRCWLEDLTRSLSPSENIVITWTEELAVATKLSVFVKYWDDFCYPMTDDTTVFPFDISWVIQYWHEEVLYFAKRLPIE